MKSKDFIKSQKIMRLATIEPNGNPHIVPVWYNYSGRKFYVGTSTRTKKAKNIGLNTKVSFCIDMGTNSHDIFGVMLYGNARLILDNNRVQLIRRKIILRYFQSLSNRSAQQFVSDTDCIMTLIHKEL